jgi:hypothetical protein
MLLLLLLLLRRSIMKSILDIQHDDARTQHGYALGAIRQVGTARGCGTQSPTVSIAIAIGVGTAATAIGGRHTGQSASTSGRSMLLLRRQGCHCWSNIIGQ